MDRLATNVDIVVGGVGYFLIVGFLLASMGIGGHIPAVPRDTDTQISETNQQNTAAFLGECVVTFIGGFLAQWPELVDCDRDTQSKLFDAFEDIGDTINLVGDYLAFFFQLLTFQLPIPALLNAIIVLPMAVGLFYVGARLMRGGG